MLWIEKIKNWSRAVYCKGMHLSLKGSEAPLDCVMQDLLLRESVPPTTQYLSSGNQFPALTNQHWAPCTQRKIAPNKLCLTWLDFRALILIIEVSFQVIQQWWTCLDFNLWQGST